MGVQATNVPEFVNRPSRGVVAVPDVIGWEHRTEENVNPMPSRTLAADASAWGALFEPLTLRKRGLTKKLLIRLTGQFTVANGTGVVTVRDIWPYGLLRMIDVFGNGAAIHHLSGWMAHVHIMRRHRNPDLSQVVTDEFAGDSTPANGDYDYEVEYEIPLCYDYATGVGAMYAESDRTTFELKPQFATKDELFSFTGTADVTHKIAPKIEASLVFWEAPREVIDGVEQLFLPDLSRLFQLQQREPEINQTGTFEALCIETPGNLACLTMAVRNNKANINIAGGGLDFVGWGYGGNLQPRLYDPPEHLLHENARLYNGLLPYRCFSLDFDSENPRRDSTRPKTATEMGARLGIPVGLSLNACRVYMLHEQLIAATNPASAG